MREIFDEIVITKNGNVNSAILRDDRLKRKYPKLYDWIMNRYPLYDDIRNKILAVRNNGYCRCQICHSIMKFPFSKARKHFCSSKCANNKEHRRGTKVSQETKEKIKKTNLQKYGVEYGFRSEEVKEKIKKTNLERYGVEYISQSEEVKNKVANTVMEKYGYRCIFNTPEMRRRCQESVLKKNGLSASKYEYIRSLGIECSKEEADSVSIGSTSGKLNSKEMIEIKLGLREPSKEIIEENYTHIYPWLHLYNIPVCRGTSAGQTMIRDYIESLGFRCLYNTRKVIAPLELDIYVPDRNFALEYDGLYWHTADRIESGYHLKKTELCLEKNITLVHITDFEWNKNREKMKELIKFHLGLESDFDFGTIIDRRYLPYRENMKIIKPEVVDIDGFRYENCGYLI